MTDSVTVLIASFLESEYVDQIRALDPRIKVVYEPDLLGHPRYQGDHSSPFQRTLAQEAHWRELLAQADVLFDFDSPNMRELPTLAPRLKWIQSTSAGIGQSVKRAGLADTGILFTTASGVHATALAEFCSMAMLMFVKDAFRMAADKQRKHWERYCGAELRGQTLAVVGLGRVGREVARVAQSLGMRVIGAKRTTAGVKPGSLNVECLYAWTEIHPMLSEADFVVLICPHTPETEGLIGEAELAAMKSGAVLINIARGTIVDEPALIHALESGHLAGAALDVFATEPLPADSPLWDMPNVLFSPHSGSTADTENGKITELFCDNLRRYLAGEPLRNLLDTGRLY